MVFVRCTHVVAGSNTSFIFIAMWNSVVWIFCGGFIHSVVDRHRDCLWFGDTTQSAAVNIPMYIFGASKHISIERACVCVA